MGSLLIIKFVLCFIIIVVLAEISKRVSPQLGGIFSGLPLGTGLTVYFISYEQGTDFTMEGVPWGISGLSASIVFCFVYFLVMKLTSSNNRIYSVILASVSSVISFLAIGLLISLVEFNMMQATILFAVTFAVNIVLIKILIGKEEVIKQSSTSIIQLLIRIILVGSILVLITGIASIVGSTWAVILTAFPSTLFPLLIVLQFEAGNKLVQYVIQGFSYSISTLVVFYFSFVYLVPIFGLNMGYLIIYVICMIYLYFFNKLR